MIRLAKYAKPYLWTILLAVGLLFIQANLELMLPDYLGRIVNTGIQQGGVENAVPQALRASRMDRLSLFWLDAEKAQVLSAYDLFDPAEPSAAQALKDVPGHGGEAVYLRKALDQEDIARLNPLFARAWMAAGALEKAAASPEDAAGLGNVFSELPSGADGFQTLQALPAAQRASLVEKLSDPLDALGETMLTQSAVGAVRAEYATLGMDTAAVQTGYIIRTGGIMLLLSLLSGGCSILVTVLASRVGAGMARDLRRAVFQKVTAFGNAEFDRFSTASLITRSTNDITQIQLVVAVLIRIVFYAPIIAVGGMIRLLGAGSVMWWLIGVAVIVSFSLIAVIMSLSLPRYRVVQNLVDRLNRISRELLSGMMVVRAFNRQPDEEKRFDQANVELTGVSLFLNRIMAMLNPTMMLIMNGLGVAIVWVGSYQVAQANLQVGDMMAVTQYAMQIVMAVLMLSTMIVALPRASVSSDRIADVLEAEPAIQDAPDVQGFPEPFRGEIEFRNVSFRYPGAEEDALHEINFTVLSGQTTALIGPTGAGKSTVVNLIPRLYEVTAGEIWMDGVDIRRVSLYDLRSKIGYVPQKSVLLSGTVESNLRYADDQAAESALHSALEIAQAEAFVAANPQGMQMDISQGGGNVSGGQKQRLSIARALVRKPPIYIFDDSFSALDFQTDAALRRALKQETGGSTVLVVSQRVSSIKDAGQIIVLDEGRMVGKGTHAELMRSCALYREIALSQLSVEEAVE